MSSYTITVRNMCKELLLRNGYKIETMTEMEIVENGSPLVFNFNFDFISTELKKDLIESFIKNFYMREIGVETIELFQFNLQNAFINIIDYYIKMYESTLLDFNPLENTSVIEKTVRKLDENKNSNQTIKGVGKEVYNDTPSSKLGDKDYATTITDQNQETEQENKYLNDTDEVIEHEKRGNIGVMTYDQLLTGYRKSILKIKEVLYNDPNITELFMMIY